MIRLEQVGFAYGRGRTVQVLQAVSFELTEGSLGLVLGGTGAGKTTLVHIAAGLLSPTAGKVTVAGRRLNLLRGKERASLRAGRVALVPQSPVLVPFLTALENVLLPTLTAKVTAPNARAEQLLAELAMAHRGRHLPAQLSSGERQRVALARALLARPQVLIADAPASHQDNDGVRLVYQRLAQCAREAGLTVLIAATAPCEYLREDRRFQLRHGAIDE